MLIQQMVKLSAGQPVNAEQSMNKVGKLDNPTDIDKPLTDEYLKIVNQAPPADQVFNHPLSTGVKFIPIAVVETMLTRLFKHWNVEILREGQILNSVYVTVRLNFLHPITKEWEHQDGIGAVQIQVDKDKPMSAETIKSNAIMLALPSAKSYAIKDAAEHIGRAFGRDINRKDVMPFNQDYNKSNIDLTNKLVKVAQIKELEEKTIDCTGFTAEQAAYWFLEMFGIQYSQVKQFEFDYVIQKIESERLV